MDILKYCKGRRNYCKKPVTRREERKVRKAEYYEPKINTEEEDRNRVEEKQEEARPLTMGEKDYIKNYLEEIEQQRLNEKYPQELINEEQAKQYIRNQERQRRRERAIDALRRL